MTAIQIRDVPEATRQVLIRAAAARDESLQVYLSEVLEQEARRVQNRELVSSYAANRRAGTRTDPVEMIREGREQRQQHIADAIQPRRK
ncbi:MAG: hypothetical protein JWP19_1935 [Rhodoglobus sp.]|nr:hypothetical protein [Rhodoglobus sp.]